MPKTASQFIVVPPVERLDEFVAVKDRFSSYLTSHFPEYAFLITGNAPFESDDFQVIPILGKASDTPDPDGGIQMLAPPERSVLDEIIDACRQFDVTGRKLS